MRLAQCLGNQAVRNTQEVAADVERAPSCMDAKGLLSSTDTWPSGMMALRGGPSPSCRAVPGAVAKGVAARTTLLR